MPTPSVLGQLLKGNLIGKGGSRALATKMAREATKEALRREAFQIAEALGETVSPETLKAIENARSVQSSALPTGELHTLRYRIPNGSHQTATMLVSDGQAIPMKRFNDIPDKDGIKLHGITASGKKVFKLAKGQSAKQVRDLALKRHKDIAASLSSARRSIVDQSQKALPVPDIRRLGGDIGFKDPNTLDKEGFVTNAFMGGKGPSTLPRDPSGVSEVGPVRNVDLVRPEPGQSIKKLQKRLDDVEGDAPLF